MLDCVTRDIAARLAQTGYFPLPCEGKTPRGVGWQSRPNPFDIDFRDADNVGIRCGDNGLLGVDVDIDDHEIASTLATKVWATLGSPLRFGRAPRHMRVVRTAEPSKSRDLRYENGATTYKIQLIGKGRQFIAFGIHPDTLQPYNWQGKSILDAPASELRLVDTEILASQIDDVMKDFGFRRRFTIERDGTGNAKTPPGLNMNEWGALAAWGQSEADATAAQLAGMGVGTGRGGFAHRLGLRIGPLITDGVISRDSICEQLFAATQDDNTSFHSFDNGVRMSEGESVAAKVEALRRGGKVIETAQAMGLALTGFDIDGTGQGVESGTGDERIGPGSGEGAEALLGALKDRATTLGALRKSKAATAARVEFSRMCAALARQKAISELQAFELGALAKDFDPNTITDGKNPRAPTPTSEDFARLVAATAGRGGDLVATLSLGEAVLKPPVMVDGSLPDLRGGTFPPDDAMFAAMSARVACVNQTGAVFYVHRALDGRDETMSDRDILKLYSNVFVGDAEGGRELAIAWWTKHPEFRPKRGVFKLHGEPEDDEYNFWRGWGVERVVGRRDRLRRFVRHLWRVVCRQDKAKFKYLWRWLAFAVQHPDVNPEVVVVLKSSVEGTGKSTVSEAMRRIFGSHAIVVSTPEQLLGKHNARLERACFVAMEEALFAGDPRQASALRSLITGSTLAIERKHIEAYEVPNMIHAILTTNHDWAVHAGDAARRWFVCEVSEERAGDKPYWDALYADMEAGGYGQLLDALLETDIEEWSPRQLVRTEELREQQRLSGDAVSQWLRAVAEDDGVEYVSVAGTRTWLQLDRAWKTATLHGAFCASLRVAGAHRPVSRDFFAKRMRKILGIGRFSKHVVEMPGDKEGKGYYLPPAELLALLTA